MSVTIKMVAERAGVSVATVSKYINGGNVYEENKVKVQQAIDELDYKINDVARSLKTSKTYTVGILVANLQSSFLTAIISKIQNTLLQHGYSTIIADYQEDKELEKKQLDVLLQKHMDGIIFFPEEDEKEIIETVKSRGIPIVLVNNMVEGSESDAVLLDNVSETYQAVEQLIKHGHKRIAIINGADTMSTFAERMKGYLRAFENYYIEVDESLIMKGPHTLDAGYEETMKLLSMENPPTALFVGNYHMALGALKALIEKKVKIPEELSVIVFDKMDFPFIMNPEISTVNQPQELMGERAALRCVQRMKGDKSNFPQVERLKAIHNITDSIGSPRI